MTNTFYNNIKLYNYGGEKMEGATFYANRVDVTTSLFDIDIKFSAVSPLRNEQGQIIGQNINTSIEVFMSPQHAKELIRVLSEQIKWYENNFGEIPMPPNINQNQ